MLSVVLNKILKKIRLQDSSYKDKEVKSGSGKIPDPWFPEQEG